jgi:hypothetical protein
MKTIFITCTLLFVGLTAFTQVSFSHAAGAKLLIASSENSSTAPIGIVYSPRLNLFEINDNSTVSIGTHATVAFSFSVGTNGSSSSGTFEIPLVAEYNFGLKSTNKNDTNLGFYLGGGYSFFDSSEFISDSAGPTITGGLRFYMGDAPLDLNISYTSTSNDVNIIGLGMHYIF